MIRYETLFLARTEITNEELSLIEKSFEAIVTAAKGKVVSLDNWGKLRLAYSVQKQEYGTYVLVRFDVPQETASVAPHEIKEFFKIKCSDFVMRHVTVRLEKDAPTNYHRPESVNAQYGSGNVDSFIKENKLDTYADKSSMDLDSDMDDSIEAAS